MLQTQILSTGASGFYGSLGAIQSSAATASLQTYLKSIGKLSAANVTGVMNDATMGVIFNLLIESAGTVAKIPLLPSDIRSGITTVVNALKSADSKIQSISFGQARLSSVISNWASINAVVRAISSSAADAMAAAREAVYNAVGGQSGIIEKAVRIFFPPAAAPGTTTTTTAFNPKTAIMTALPMQFLVSAQASPGTAPGAAPTFPAGTIFAPSVKFPGKYRVAVPKVAGGLGGVGVMSDGVFGECLFGDCGLGGAATFTEVAPVAAPPSGATQVTEKTLEDKTGQTPLYKKPLFWAAVAGGVLVVGGGGYWLVRRRKTAKAA